MGAIFLVERIVETTFYTLIYLIFSVSNLYRYSGFRSLKNVASKNGNLLKPSKIKGSGHAYLRAECSHVSEMERPKTEILGVKWQNWRKRGTGVKQHLNAVKPANTWVLRAAKSNLKRREKSYFSKIWRRERDSNPRYSFKLYTRFPIGRLQPLGHLSLHSYF